jgi:hypothetical protein
MGIATRSRDADTTWLIHPLPFSLDARMSLISDACVYGLIRNVLGAVGILSFTLPLIVFFAEKLMSRTGMGRPADCYAL